VKRLDRNLCCCQRVAMGTRASTREGSSYFEQRVPIERERGTMNWGVLVGHVG
jgi:hypothetical protein